MSIHLSVPLVALWFPFRLFLHVRFSLSLSTALSLFLSLLRIYRGEQRMWMGWVSPRLGERSITCEPKGEEIRGCAAYLQERSGAQAGMVEYCGTRAVCPTPLSLSPSRTLLAAAFLPFRSFAPSFHRPSRAPPRPLLTCGTSRGLSIIIALRARAP